MAYIALDKRYVQISYLSTETYPDARRFNLQHMLSREIRTNVVMLVYNTLPRTVPKKYTFYLGVLT